MSSRGRLVVFTAVIGDRDPLRPPAALAADVDYICFTDRLDRPSLGWTLRPVEWVGRDPVRTARKYKLLSHQHLGEYRYSLWLDANITPACDPWSLVEEFGGGADIVLHQHPHRSCAYDETAVCISMHKDLISTLERQRRHYEQELFPHHHGLYETGVLLRRHSDAVSAFNERWWREVVEFSSRDQISFPFALMKSPVTVARFPFPLRENSFLHYHHHESCPHRRYRAYLAARRFAGRTLRALYRAAQRPSAQP